MELRISCNHNNCVLKKLESIVNPVTHKWILDSSNTGVQDRETDSPSH